MKIKRDITVGVISKVREYYVTEPRLAGLITVDVMLYQERSGDDVQIYYPELLHHDRVFVNGVEFVAKEKAGDES